MAKYTVGAIFTKTVYEEYTVTADSSEEAIRKFHDGEADLDVAEDRDIVDEEITIVKLKD